MTAPILSSWDVCLARACGTEHECVSERERSKEPHQTEKNLVYVNHLCEPTLSHKLIRVLFVYLPVSFTPPQCHSVLYLGLPPRVRKIFQYQKKKNLSFICLRKALQQLYLLGYLWNRTWRPEMPRHCKIVFLWVFKFNWAELFCHVIQELMDIC